MSECKAMVKPTSTDFWFQGLTSHESGNSGFLLSTPDCLNKKKRSLY